MFASVTDDRRLRTFLMAASVVVIVGGLRSAAGVLNPLLMAAVVVSCAAPLQEQLRRRGLGRRASMVVTALTVVLGLLAFVVMIGYAGKALVETVPRYQHRLASLVSSGAAWLDARGIDASQSRLLALINPARLIGMASELVQGVAGAVSVALLIVMLSIFLLVESAAFWRRGERDAPKAALPTAWQRRFDAIATDVQQYVWITLVTGAMFAAAVWLVMVLLGVDLPALWAVLALLLSFVPGIGFVLSMIPPAALTLLEFGPGRAGVVVLAFVVVNNVVDNVIKPHFMKQGFDLGPFVMFSAILFWAYVLGPTGALLAVPLTTAVRRLFFTPDPPAEESVIVSAREPG